MIEVDLDDLIGGEIIAVKRIKQPRDLIIMKDGKKYKLSVELEFYEGAFDNVFLIAEEYEI